ncbi:GntR family transcriptional regulator [Nonomuraea sp. SYSU D8015]|uniref:GntR family transcriptional regulator n=1 Tax=Nonomuraea sp. SYSU D8015 TaxID=2593644 RepID=UPI001CB75094
MSGSSTSRGSSTACGRSAGRRPRPTGIHARGAERAVYNRRWITDLTLTPPTGPPRRGTSELRRRILTGDLPPGVRLVEDRLTAQHGVSRNWVRESIRVLAA